MRRTPLYLAMLVLVACSSHAGAQPHRPRAFATGVKVGAGLSDISLSAPCYNVYSHHAVADGSLGGWLQWRSSGGFTMRAEAALRNPGTRLSWEDIDYRLREYTLGVRLAAQIDMPLPRSFSVVYLVAAPELAATVGGSVGFASPETGDIDMALNASDTRPLDLDIFFGLGVEFPFSVGDAPLLLAVEGGYRFGLVSSFTGIDIGSLQVLNLGPGTVQPAGSRLRRGAELTLRLGIPFGRKVRFARGAAPAPRRSRSSCEP